jgi:hypothetical protein
VWNAAQWEQVRDEYSIIVTGALGLPIDFSAMASLNETFPAKVEVAVNSIRDTAIPSMKWGKRPSLNTTFSWTIEAPPP